MSSVKESEYECDVRDDMSPERLEPDEELKLDKLELDEELCEREDIGSEFSWIVGMSEIMPTSNSLKSEIECSSACIGQ